MSAQDTVFSQKTERIFSPQSGAVVMGILNVTPDSFHDGGRYQTTAEIVDRAGLMITEGAGIIDIGACSTRPGAAVVPPDEELARLIPAIQAVRKAFPDILVSADTYRAQTAEQAAAAGANIINDISGGTLDPDMFSTVVKLNVPYVLMHISGTPQTMQRDPQYNDVLADVIAFFHERIQSLVARGFAKIILDPGFGFGKTNEHNFTLLQGLGEIGKLGYPVLAGISRKSMINRTLGISSKDALNGTSVLNTVALLKGAKILRVHDVKEARQAVILLEKLSE